MRGRRAPHGPRQGFLKPESGWPGFEQARGGEPVSARQGRNLDPGQARAPRARACQSAQAGSRRRNSTMPGRPKPDRLDSAGRARRRATRWARSRYLASGCRLCRLRWRGARRRNPGPRCWPVGATTPRSPPQCCPGGATPRSPPRCCPGGAILRKAHASIRQTRPIRLFRSLMALNEILRALQATRELSLVELYPNPASGRDREVRSS